MSSSHSAGVQSLVLTEVLVVVLVNFTGASVISVRRTGGRRRELSIEALAAWVGLAHSSRVV